MRSKALTPYLIGAALGAVVISITGFTAGWVTSSGRATAMAAESSTNAVKAQLVPICLHQSRADAAFDEKLETLRSLGQWKREEFVTQQGWSVMPGSDSDATGVARECAAQLIATQS